MNDDEDAHDEEIDVGEEIWWYLAEDKGLGPGLPPDIGDRAGPPLAQSI